MRIIVLIFLGFLILTGCSTAQRMFRAARRGDTQTLKVCQKNGAHLEVRDKTGATILHWAALEGREDTVRWLLDQGLSPNLTEHSTGYTPLHMAALRGQNRVVTLLLNRGADPDSRDLTYGNTPLFWAGAYGHLDTVRILVESGADPAVTNRTGYGLLHVAARDGHHSLLLYYTALGLPLDRAHPANGITPLMVACMVGNYPGMRILLTNGADPFLTNDQGQSALSYAMKLRRKSLYNFITNYINTLPLQKRGLK